MPSNRWANENSGNVPISSTNGELASIAKAFPDVECEVEYENDNSGSLYAPDFKMGD